MNFLKKEVSVDDVQLNSASQQKMASLVKGIRDEEVSMSWRSELNTKLFAAQQAQAKKRKTRRFYAWGSSLSLGLAATVFGVMLMNPAPQMVQPHVESTAFASELVKAHQESMVLASVSGTGAAARETSYIDDSYGLQDELL